MDDSVKIGSNRQANGRFGKGNIANPHGRPIKPEVELLRIALEEEKKKHGGKHLINHAIDQAYIDNNVLIAILKKILPDKLQGEGFATKSYIIIRHNQEADTPTR